MCPWEWAMFNRESLYIQSEKYKQTLNTSDCEEDKEITFDFDTKREKPWEDKEFSSNWVKKLFIIGKLKNLYFYSLNSSRTAICPWRVLQLD